MMTWNEIKYFKPHEFDSPDAPGSGSHMDLSFVHKLDKIRSALGKPMRINSGYRTFNHNKKVGGVPDSAHTRGLAADIALTSSGMRYALVQLALSVGITRIGIGNTLVHLDMDTTLPDQVIWVYDGK